MNKPRYTLKVIYRGSHVVILDCKTTKEYELMVSMLDNNVIWAFGRDNIKNTSIKLK